MWWKLSRPENAVQVVLRDHTVKFSTNVKADDEKAKIDFLFVRNMYYGQGVEWTLNVKLGGKELYVEDIIENYAEPLLPLSIADNTDDVSSDHRLDWRYLIAQHDRLLIFQVQTTAEMAMREYWVNNRHGIAFAKA